MEKHSQISVAGTYHLTPQDHVWGNSPLHSACYHGKLDVVQLLVLNQPNLDINLRNHRGDSPLTLACQASHLDVIHFLLTLSSCDINHTNKAGDTPLHVACFEGHTAAVKVLCSLDKGAVDSINRAGDSPLALACRGGHLDVIKFLIESMHSSTSTQNEDGDTPLHIACSHGNSQVVKFLLPISNSDINTKNADGNTSLHLACQNGWKHIVEFLVNEINHIDVNQPNNDGNTPLHVAILSHQKDITDLLSHHHKCNTKITNKDGNTPLHLVCMEGWTDIVEYLLGTGGNDVNAQNIQGNTPLHISCQKGHTDILRFIVTQKFCNISSKNEQGNTPLNLACLEGKLAIARLLVDMKPCDLNHKNKAGVCALHLAFYNRHRSIVEVLIRHDRCDVNCTDAVENTPLGLAANLGWTDVVEFLITKKQCNTNHQNMFGDTPLHLSKCMGVAELLTCDVNYKNSRGDTALSIACQCDLDLVKFLIEIKHCKVETQNEDRDSPLHHACRHGKLSILKYLLSKQLLPVNCENNAGNTPLCVAAGTVYSDVVQFLVDIDDCEVNHQNKNGDTPLHIACRIGDIHVVRALVLTDFRNKKVSFNVKNKHQQTPALIAFHRHSDNIFRLLVTEHHYECLISVLEKINKGQWPEVVRILTNVRSISMKEYFIDQSDVFQFLFERRVWDLNGLDVHGNTPLHIACLAGDLNVVRILTGIIDCKLNVKNNKQETPALIAFYRHHNDIFRLLVTEHHCEYLLSVLERINKDQWPKVVKILAIGRSISVKECFEYEFDVVQFLFEERVWDLNGLDDDGNTPLHIACLAGDLDVVRFLTGIIECKLNAKNNKQDTPALIAFNRHHNDIFRLLVTEHHCKCLISVLEIINKDQWPEVLTILTIGTSVSIPKYLKYQSDVVRFLFEKRVWDVNGLDVHGNTPLHIACLAGDLNIVRIIISFANCDYNIQNRDGNTPANLITEHHYMLLVNILENVNKDVWPQIIRSITPTGNSDLSFESPFDVICFLFKEGVWDLNCLDDDGNTPLHIACLEGDLNAIRHLISIIDHQVNVKNNKQETPALIAFNRHHNDIFRLLVTAHSYECLLSVLESINEHQWPKVVGMLTVGRTVTVPSELESPFDVIHFLLKKRVWGLNGLDIHGNTPLHIACKVASFTVEHLINYPNCNLNRQNSTGDTPLHLACIGFIVQPSVTHEKCNVDIQNHDGDTPLTLACRFANQHLVQQLINTKKCDINHQNKDGNSPLHNACRSGNLAIVGALLTKNCNIILRNRQGETPALVAFNHQQPDILRLLITEQHCEYLIDLLEMVSKEKWPDVVKILAGDRRVSICTISSALDVVKLLVSKQIWSTKCQDENGNSALHHACYYGHTGLVRYLVDDQKLDIIHTNRSGNTPLHTACLQGHSEVIKAMLTITTMKTAFTPDVPNIEGDTPLHFACAKGHLQVVKILLSSGLFDPTACNVAGITPVELARSYQVITECVSRYVGFKSSNPLWSNVKVCVVGNHCTGKTTLVEVLQRETKIWMKVVPKKFKKVSNVESCTCGIIPVQLHSKRFGNIILYDFAGHVEYYSSHAAVLENFRSSSPSPIFIILIKLVESEEEIKRNLYYWTSMVENHCKTMMTLPRVIVVGSFADKVKKLLPQKVKHVKYLLDVSLSSSCSLQFVGFVPLDCRLLASQGNDTLCKLLGDNCHTLQETADTSFACHVLYALLNDKFKDNVACTVSEVMNCIHSDDANEDLLPHDTGDLVHLLKALSDYGEILLLLNQEHPQNSWVILDKSVLLSEINGTVFAPEQFERRYKGFLMSTGVVPLSKIQEAFPKYDSEMITAFLIYLEFCQEVKDPDALGGITVTHFQLTQSTTPSAVTEKYFFFPALVNLEKPTDVWEDSEDMHYNCGWLLECTKPDKFLTSRFIHVLLLRLAFSYALTPKSPEDPSYPVLRKRCSVWKNGIQWWSRAGGIETIVEVREQTKLVAILMRCTTKAETECAKLRSSVIEKILSVQKEFCSAVTSMDEYLIYPDDVQYPLPSTQQLKLFSHEEIAELVIANPKGNEQFAIEETASGVMDAQQLLLFEPYLGLGEALVQQLFSDKVADKIVSENFLDKLAECVFQRMPLIKKILNIPEIKFAECHGQAQVQQCRYLFKLWSQQRDKATYRSLRREFDRYSIFHGRNPLEVARSGTTSSIPLQDIDIDTPGTVTAGYKKLQQERDTIIGYLADQKITSQLADKLLGAGFITHPVYDQAKGFAPGVVERDRVTVMFDAVLASMMLKPLIKYQQFLDILKNIEGLDDIVDYINGDGGTNSHGGGVHVPGGAGYKKLQQERDRIIGYLADQKITSQLADKLLGAGFITRPVYDQAKVFAPNVVERDRVTILFDAVLASVKLKPLLKYQQFLDILKDIEGLDDIVDIISGDGGTDGTGGADGGADGGNGDHGGGIGGTGGDVHVPGGDTNSHDSEVVLQSRDSHSITSGNEDSNSQESTTGRIVSHSSDHPLKPNADPKKDAPSYNTSTFLELIRFRGRERRINVPQEIGVHYIRFGTLLLEDPNGMAVQNIERKHMKDAEEINMEVLQEWVEGRGKQPVTWDTLIGVLRDAELTTLASEIAAVKGSSGE